MLRTLEIRVRGAHTTFRATAYNCSFRYLRVTVSLKVHVLIVLVHRDGPSNRHWGATIQDPVCTLVSIQESSRPNAVAWHHMTGLTRRRQSQAVVVLRLPSHRFTSDVWAVLPAGNPTTPDSRLMFIKLSAD